MFRVISTWKDCVGLPPYVYECYDFAHASRMFRMQMVRREVGSVSMTYEKQDGSFNR